MNHNLLTIWSYQKVKLEYFYKNLKRTTVWLTLFRTVSLDLVISRAATQEAVRYRVCANFRDESQICYQIEALISLMIHIAHNHVSKSLSCTFMQWILGISSTFESFRPRNLSIARTWLTLTKTKAIFNDFLCPLKISILVSGPDFKTSWLREFTIDLLQRIRNYSCFSDQ